jgi:hypothetical protein
MEFAAVRVAAPPHALLDERPEAGGEHGQCPGRRLVHGLVPGAEHQPGQPAVVAGHTPAAQEELVLQVVQQGQDRRAPVRRGPSGQARHRAFLAHRRHVVVVAQVHQPVGDPPPDAAPAQVDVLLGAHPAHGGVGERHLHRVQQARFPPGVGVDQDDDLAARGADAHPERRSLAPVLEDEHAHARVGHGPQPALDLHVLDVRHDDDFVRVLRQPALQAFQQDVRVLPVGRYDYRDRGPEVVLHRPGEPGQHRPVQPEQPDEEAGQAERHHLPPGGFAHPFDNP